MNLKPLNMKTIKNILLILIIGFSVVSCENKLIDEILSNRSSLNKTTSARDPDIDDEEEPPMYNEDDMIVLGNQRDNPYEIDNMLYAYSLIGYLSHNFLVGDEEPEVNTIYYRVLPTDSSDLAIISADTTVLYFDFPLDYDITQWGSYYHDPTVLDSAYTWLYAVVPAGHQLPQVSNLEVLQECYIPNEPTGEIGVDYDTIPDWQNGFALLEYVAYRESGNLDMFEQEDIDNFEEILALSADWGESSAQRDRSSRSFWSWLRGTITGVHPEGTFRVENTETNSNERLKNAKVLIHNFVKIYSGNLNSYGHYYSSVRFRTRSWYHIRFHNHHTGTRIYSGRKLIFGPYDRRLGWHSRNGYSCTLTFNDVAWRYATINNASEVYFDYCQEYGIIFPYNLRVWALGIDSNLGRGCTPLFNKRNVPIAAAAFFILPIAGIILAFTGAPDVGIFVQQGDRDFETLELYGLVFHEFGHASHYEKVGNTYWHNYVSYIICNLGYGDGHDPDAGYCGIGEMWGNFVGSCFANKYLGHPHPYLFINYYGYQNSYLYSGHYDYFNAWEDWYHPGILAKIHEDSGCSITDIYNALHSDVFSLDILQYSLQNEGINNNIIVSAYDLYNYWNPQYRRNP